MTNKAYGFAVVNSKEVVAAGSKVTFPVQVRMTIEVAGKTQGVAFGYSRLGGRKTYVVAEGKAPVSMSRADFVKTLRSRNISNIKQVEKMLSGIRYFHRDEFIVSKCECCSGYVTAANVDYMQRNHAKLSEKLGRTLSEHSRICYKCQGHEGEKPAPAPVNEKPAVIPAKAEAATCAHCKKEVKSQKVAEFSLKTFGKVLCFKPCQSKYPKLEKQQTSVNEKPAKEKPPVNQKEETVAPKSQEKATVSSDSLFTPALVAEIMALEVDPFSEIAKLQEQIQCLYQDDQAEQQAAWFSLHEDQVAEKSASEASSYECVICNTEMPEGWNHDICPSCTLRPDGLIEFPESQKQAARDVLAEENGEVARASEASATGQTEEAGNDVVNQEEAKEEPHGEQEEETVCKSQDPAAEVNASHQAELDHDYAEFMETVAVQFQDADVPPMPEDGQLPW